MGDLGVEQDQLDYPFGQAESANTLDVVETNRGRGPASVVQPKIKGLGEQDNALSSTVMENKDQSQIGLSNW